MKKSIFISFIVFLIFSCNKIETDKTLKYSDIEYIQNLGLLDKDEKILKFYSEFNKTHAGNFFTNKRIAKYWIDDKSNEKNHLDFAFYNEIKSIDTIYNAGATFCPYLEITKLNGKTFVVCVDGDKKEIKSFFEDAINQWKKNKQ